MMTPRRWLAGLTLSLLIALGLPLAAEAQTSAPFRVQLVQGDDPTRAITDRARCRVVNAGLLTEPTIYTTASLGTAASNPLLVSTTSGEVEFFMDGSTTTVDMMCWVSAGPYKGSRARLDAHKIGRASCR